MATQIIAKPLTRAPSNGDNAHRFAVTSTLCVAAVITLALAMYGLDYYTLPLAGRVFSPKHALLRSSGSIGLRLGMLGAALFVCLYLYAIRKRWPWLGRIGKTRRWLDFHVLFGIMAPVLITFHAAFRFQGIAGVAYWIMISVMLSGFVGRYFYAQIPRSVSAAEMSLKDLQAMAGDLAAQVESQQVIAREQLQELLALPAAHEVDEMPLAFALLAMVRLDLARPRKVAAIRRKGMGALARLRSCYGYLPSSNPELERVIAAVRKQSWITTKILFLNRTQEVFHLWHVVHRPFSYSFAALVMVHIGVVVFLGYY